VAGELDLDDIQGNVLRGYNFAHARHFALGVTEAAGARRFIAALASGDEKQSPQVSTEEEWDTPSGPPYRLNLGLTWAGLKALGVAAATLAEFPAAFREGPAERADPPDPDFPGHSVGLGDLEASAPTNWILGGEKDPPVHLILSLYTDDQGRQPLEQLSARLRELFGPNGISEISQHDADALPNKMVHFGYRDGIAQPRIRGAPSKQPRPDMQPEAEPGDFLLGCDYVNVYGGNYLEGLPPQLGDNATYAAFRILRQDVSRFEALLHEWATRYKLNPELLAAKLVGRWRNGVPLTLSPETHTTPIEESELNNFDYAPQADPPPGHTAFFDDVQGRRCPIGSHIRRSNPRGSLVMGHAHSRRLIRRSMPYGPQYDPVHPDETERGLIGLFVCGDLEMQYEFILRVWLNQDLATHGLRGTRDPLIGAQPEPPLEGGAFVVRTDDGRDPIRMIELPRLVQTRGSVYCLIPGIKGLQHLAEPPVGAAGEP
jgi:deferrochelatase/peroxidase EfeB